ncbi:site-2 protease family protein [Kibdelosporangium aridum]|uniref:Zinc metalloprotease n=1 Tax=Kibdelosporangium aridum TaxID=2030 RepID=A0A428Z3V0_KIBAR|nr:site-2 protease family protein [Kibdelosporangium aridum]RSM80890.1 site-2 protease family protein [Kibdelosporangium aridum]
MRATIKFGRIAGVAVGAHWSVLGVVLLLVVGLSAQLPVSFPGYSVGEYVLAAAVASVLFVLSLLAHEMAHAVTAKRNGIEVVDITLWLLGGVARLRGEARTPGADFRIAVVGPATSLAVGGVFGVLVWLAWGIGIGLLGIAVLMYLAGLNVLLAVFNLIPAAPLDGGRILRAAVWAWRGDRLMAAVWSARAGRVFGLLVIGVGLVLVWNDVIGLWWVVLGLFVVTMAGAEEQQAQTGAALGGLRVRDVMTAQPDTVRADRTVADFLHEVAFVRRHSAFPVLDDRGQLQGMITLNRLTAVPVARRATTALRDVACPSAEVPSAQPEEPLSALLSRMDGCADGRALVFGDDHLVGIVSPSDISRAVTLHGLGVHLDAGGADLTRTTPEDHR